MAGNQAAARRFGIGAGDGRHRDAEMVGQVAVGRQPGAGAQRPLLHVLIDGVRDRPVNRAAAGIQRRQPHCHHRNIRIVRGAMGVGH
jgi:hypothetical protein